MKEKLTSSYVDEESSPKKIFFSEPRDVLAQYSSKVEKILDPIQEDLGELKSTSTHYGDKTRNNSQIQDSMQSSQRNTRSNSQIQNSLQSSQRNADDKLENGLMLPQKKINVNHEDGLEINTRFYENIPHTFDNLSPIENHNRKNVPLALNVQLIPSNLTSKSNTEGEISNGIILRQELAEVPERSIESERTYDLSTVRSSRGNSNADLLKARTSPPKLIFLKISASSTSIIEKASGDIDNTMIKSNISNPNELSAKNHSKRAEKEIKKMTKNLA